MLITLSGYTKTGKDTAADYLHRMHGFVPIAFADGAYKEVSSSFGVDVDFLKDREVKNNPNRALSIQLSDNIEYIQLMEALGYDLKAPRTSREILQTWGTEYRRGQDDNYWIKRTKEFIMLSDHDDFVVTDARYQNEVWAMVELGSVLIRLEKDGCGPINDHSSEWVLPIEQADYVIYNNGTIGELCFQLDARVIYERVIENVYC